MLPLLDETYEVEELVEVGPQEQIHMKAPSLLEEPTKLNTKILHLIRKFSSIYLYVYRGKSEI